MVSPNPPEHPENEPTDTHDLDDHKSKAPSAGLTFAPPYDPSQEMDPRSAPVMAPKAALRREDFEYFRKQMERKAMLGRTVLLLVVFGLLLANIWLTQQNTSDIVTNIDATRLHQSDIDDKVQQRLLSIETQLQAITEQNRQLLERAGANKAAPSAPAVEAVPQPIEAVPID